MSDTTVSKDDMIKEICDAFVGSEALWTMKNDAFSSPSTTVIYYLTAMRMVSEKELFQDDYVRLAVIDFLEKKVDEASERITNPMLMRIKGILAKHQS
jgi:hypothetical protein